MEDINKDIEILEEIKDMFIHLKNYGWINDIKKDIDTDKAIQTIENIINRNKELEKGNSMLKKAHKISENVTINVMNKSLEDFTKEYIPVSLVLEIIQELKEEGNYKTIENQNGRVHFQAEPCDYKIQALKELLERGSRNG